MTIGDGRPRARQQRCGTIRNSSASTIAARRTTERQVIGARSVALAIEGDTIKFHAVIDEAIAEPFGDDLLQRLELRIDEFDDLAGLDVDQMVVMRLGRSEEHTSELQSLMRISYAVFCL